GGNLDLVIRAAAFWGEIKRGHPALAGLAGMKVKGFHITLVSGGYKYRGTRAVPRWLCWRTGACYFSTRTRSTSISGGRVRPVSTSPTISMFVFSSMRSLGK